jgi:protein-disulfide isomerase
MTKRKLTLAVGLPLVFLLCAPPSRAQQTPEDLAKQIEALTQAVKAMQKDVQEIKTMLQSRVQPPPPQNVVLDLAGRPSKGENTAKLTLIEFSDYQ